MRKILAMIFGILIALFGYTFAWQSGEFLDEDFWNGNGTVDEKIYPALFGNSAYTDIREGYGLTSCSIEKIITTSELSGSLEENTIYILNTGFISVKETINVGNCIAIISRSGTIINNEVIDGDIFLFKGHFSILDNIKIYGNKQGSGITIDNTHSITINNVSLENLVEGIFSNKSDYTTYNNVKIGYIEDYAFLVSDSKNNKITNLFSYNNVREGLLIEGGGFNILSGINCYNNTGAGIYIDSSINNKLYNIYSYNNKQGIWLYDGSNNNEIYDSVISWNKQGGLVISSNHNNVKNIYLKNNREGVSIYGEFNDLSTFYSFNNKTQGINIMTGNNNTIDNGYIYNNSSHGILLYNASNNAVTNTQTFNNGQIISGSSRCGIMLYGNSNNNSFKNVSIYNNLIGVCFESDGHPITNNTFEDMRILNNKANEHSNGKLTGNTFSGVITTFDLTKTGNFGSKTGKTTKTGIQINVIELRTGDKILISGFNTIKPGISLIQRIVKPSFDYMINPHVGDIYLYSWRSEYSDIIGYNSKFLNINDKIPEYSVGIMLQDEITGHIISNGINVVADGNINSYNIMGKEYVGNNLRNTLNENINTGDVKHTVATNISGENVHTMLVLDIEAPTCEIVYSTTGATTENVIAYLTGCSEEIAGTDTSYPFTKNGEYTFNFTDLVGNSGSARAIVSRIKPKPSGNGGGGGGGGGGSSLNSETHNASIDSGNNSSKFSFNTGNFDSSYSEEMNMAYQYAYHYKITTQKFISEAGMDQGLTRIAMAKMLSMYAINVLGKKPANVIVPEFSDVSDELDAQYDNGLTLSYQLGIMGINMPNNEFRPYDLVTRAEFATALSRLLYGTIDGTDAYYSTHLDKLLEKGIIANTTPDLQELRGYVMIMLMRSALGISSVEDFVYPEPEPQDQEIVRYFTEPYKKGQIYSRIGDLQDLLRYLGYYKYGTNYVYSKATINAVYDFQVAIGLIDADDVNNPARGYLGPETRNALNEKWAEFQQYKNGIANE